MKTLKPSDCRQLKWKNGQGVTAEIAIEPTGCDFSKDEFDWRLSSAQVGQGGPFSQFPGCDRFLTIVSGGEMKLQMPEEEKLLREGKVIHFSGEVPITCELAQGPITDLNLIYRRDRVTAKFEVIDVGPRETTLLLTAKTTLIFLMKTGETIRVDGPGEVTLDGKRTPRVALIEIRSARK